MRFTVRLFGLTVLDVEASTEDAEEYDAGSVTTYPVGFVASAGDCAWEAGVER